LILSDVIGDSLDVIGSGLTTPDPTTFEDAIAILEQYGLRPSLSPLVVEYLQRGREGNVPETMKPSDSAFKKVMNHIIASNRHACEAARLNLQAAGVETFHLTSFLQGEASQVGRVFASFARQLCTSPPDRASPICWIAGGETTVTVRGNGIGGRNLELALGAVTDMNGLDRALLLTLATDGDDGFSHAAGAVVNGETARRAKNLGMSPAEFLRKNDSFSFFSRLEDCIYTSPTHTNVNDLVILFIG
jgi:hydroxypyruvate reductase